ncbi:nuclear transport factor 2 family protein [Pseudonocardia sp. NPDC049154]|uniref:nuclear transport factor 2 family protein n=1 Tax=Pseudonocardia sp. NPDC049154 TaxID=3155501 RepID=UPI0033DB3076
MADTAADLAQRLYEALATGDTDALARILAPDFVSSLADGMPGGVGGVHRGADRMWAAGWAGIGRSFAARAEPENLLAVEGGRLLVTGRYRGVGRRGGSTLDAAFVQFLERRAPRFTGRLPGR